MNTFRMHVANVCTVHLPIVLRVYLRTGQCRPKPTTSESGKRAARSAGNVPRGGCPSFLCDGSNIQLPTEDVFCFSRKRLRGGGIPPS